MNRPEFHLLRSTRRISAVFLSVAVLALHACGGGVEGQGTGSVSYSEGPIGGFGSVIVNGVHFDDSQARIVDADGHTLQSGDLKLGMTVQIDAGAIDHDSTHLAAGRLCALDQRDLQATTSKQESADQSCHTSADHHNSVRPQRVNHGGVPSTRHEHRMERRARTWTRKSSHGAAMP